MTVSEDAAQKQSVFGVVGLVVQGWELVVETLGHPPEWVKAAAYWMRRSWASRSVLPEAALSRRLYRIDSMRVRSIVLPLFVVGLALRGAAQYKPIGPPRIPLGNGPYVYDTAEQHKLKVTVVARGLQHPWGMVTLPGGDVLVTERAGRIRLVRNGVLDPTPVATIQAYAFRNSGLFDIALHPKFAENKLVYFTYMKPKVAGKIGDGDEHALAVARGHFDGKALTGIEDVFVAPWTTLNGGSRIAFAPDGSLFMTTTGVEGTVAQDLTNDYGKVLHLTDTGAPAKGNPFAGKPDARPEIYSYGHRDQLGLAISPDGVVFSCENGPNGGDELNVILPGRNYGWPLVSYGHTYEGPRVSAIPTRDGVEDALVVWLPSVSPSGLVFYTGDKFPAWKGNLITGGLQRGEIVGSGSLQRIVFSPKMEEIRRESLLEDLKQRIRDVIQAPDGTIYALTEEADGALLHLEPAT